MAAAKRSVDTGNTGRCHRVAASSAQCPSRSTERDNDATGAFSARGHDGAAPAGLLLPLTRCPRSDPFDDGPVAHRPGHAGSVDKDHDEREGGAGAALGRTTGCAVGRSGETRPGSPGSGQRRPVGQGPRLGRRSRGLWPGQAGLVTWGEPGTGWAAGDRSVLWLWTGLGGLGIVRTRKRPVPSAAPACALDPGGTAPAARPAPPAAAGTARVPVSG